MAMTNFVKTPDYEVYKEIFKEHFFFDKREDGVLLVQMHTQGGPVYWSEELHRALWQMWMTVGADPTVECVIFTGTGDRWIKDSDPGSWLDEINDPKSCRYDHMYFDGRRMLMAMIYCTEVPLIGAINGNALHSEFGLMCDICIMADDAIIFDPHFRAGMVPGDGIQIALRELMGTRRATYAMYMNENIDAKKALEYGLVNEIVPRDKLIDRAYEIADIIMMQERPTRRLTSSVLRRRWRQLLADELDGSFGTEMFGDFIQKKDIEHASISVDRMYSNTSELVPEEKKSLVHANAAKIKQ